MTIQDLSSYQIDITTIQQTQRGLTKKDAKLYETCQDFEALFIKQMLNSMRQTVNKTGMLDGGMAEDVFEDMLYDEYSKLMAKNANLGLTDLLYKQLSNT